MNINIRCFVSAICAFAFLNIACIETASADAEKGKEVFYGKGGCVACHNIGGGDRNTGPDLMGVTKRRSTDWLTRWSAVVKVSERALVNGIKPSFPIIKANKPFFWCDTLVFRVFIVS